MAWANVSSKIDLANGGGGTSTNTATFGANVTSGNLLIVAITPGNSQAINSVADTVGTTYVNLTGGNQNGSSVFYGIAGGSGANTLTIHLAGTSNFPVVWLYEFSGNASSSPLDKQSSANGTSTAVNSGATATTTSASELLFGYLQPSADMSAGGDEASWTVSHDHPSSGSAAQYRIVSATGAYTATGTSTTSALWVAFIGTFFGGGALTPINATVSLAGKSVFSHGGRLLNNATISI